MTAGAISAASGGAGSVLGAADFRCTAVNSGAVNLGGPGLIPLDYSPVNHDGYPGEQIGVVHDGGMVLSGPVYATHDDGPVLALPPVITSPPHHF